MFWAYLDPLDDHNNDYVPMTNKYWEGLDEAHNPKP